MPVYFIHNLSLSAVKVGVSGDVQSRFAALRTASPCPLRLLGSVIGERDEERRIHRDLAAYRMEGEWFSDHPTVMAYIRALLRPQTAQAAFEAMGGEPETLIGSRALILSEDRRATVEDATEVDGALFLTFLTADGRASYPATECVLLTGQLVKGRHHG